MRRKHRPSMFDVHAPYVWAPGPEPLYLRSFGDLVELALGVVPDLPVKRDAFVLLDDDDLVRAILFDPTPALKAGLASAMGPGLEEPFSKVIVVTLRKVIDMAPPSDEAMAWYQLHRSVLEGQGLTLVDFIEVSDDAMRSYAAMEGRYDVA